MDAQTKLRQYKAVDVADFFVLKGISDAAPVTQMALQKMTFFAHGLFLADTNGSPLIREKFEAWKFGPVVPDIYHRFKIYGNGEILDLFPLTLLGYSPIDNNCSFEPKAMEILNATWDNLKDLNAIQLSNWTHREGSAWSKVYNPILKSNPIPNDLILQDFKQFIKE